MRNNGGSSNGSRLIGDPPKRRGHRLYINMWYVYVLKSEKNNKLYAGVTDDLERRFKEHNSGKGGKYTKDNRPFKLIFYEAYINKLDAYKAEKFFKSGYGKEVLKDKLENYFKK